MLEALCHTDFYDPDHPQLHAVIETPRKSAVFARPTARAPRECVAEALLRIGVHRLYAHQAAALSSLDRGHSVVVTTPTSSGKSLCYLVPIMEAVARDRNARAMLMFPTKALAHDQLRVLRALDLGRDMNAALAPAAYDRDTPQASRKAVRYSARCILTNPDMVHVALLPHHALWRAFLQNLRYVVVDEAHMYRGTFGANVAFVLRRLRRLCEIYGSSPQFVFCTATIGNPREHCMALAGLESVDLIDADTAAGGTRTYALWVPPPQTDGARTSPVRDKDGAAKLSERKSTLHHAQHGVTDTAALARVAGAEEKTDVSARATLGERGSAKRPHASSSRSAAYPLRATKSARLDDTGERQRNEVLSTTSSQCHGDDADGALICDSGGSSGSSREIALRSSQGGDVGSAFPSGVPAGSSLRLQLSGDTTSCSIGDTNRDQSRSGKGSNAESIRADMPGGAATKRRSANTETASVFAELVRHDYQTIVFVPSRAQAELIVEYARERLRACGLEDSICAYRGGYQPTRRREIEHALSSRTLRGVVATNALELGVDIGELDAVICEGYPGSMASFLQRAGRAGRGGRDALIILVAREDPLNEYFVRSPRALLERQPEPVVIDPENACIVERHLMCASAEQPVLLSERAGLASVAALRSAARALVDGDLAVVENGALRYAGASPSPALSVPLRDADRERFTLIDQASNAVIEEVDRLDALLRVYPGAVVLSDGAEYLVVGWSVPARRIALRRTRCDYFTECVDHSTVTVLRRRHQRILGSAAGKADDRGSTSSEHVPRRDDAPQDPVFIATGGVCVEKRAVAYRKRKRGTGAVIERRSLSLPPVAFDTAAAWIDLPPRILRPLSNTFASIHATEHALVAYAPLCVVCEPGDVCGATCASSPAEQSAAIERWRMFLYDNTEGGSGVSAALYDRFSEVVQLALRSLSACTCCTGCPSCIMLSRCGMYNHNLDRVGALSILHALAGASEQK